MDETGETGLNRGLKTLVADGRPAPKEGQERENQASMEAPTRTEPK